jgi:hypothetical protein
MKIGFAGGALESLSITIILFVCGNPNTPHQGAARRADRSFYHPFWKRNRPERRHGRPHVPTRDAANSDGGSDPGSGCSDRLKASSFRSTGFKLFRFRLDRS